MLENGQGTTGDNEPALKAQAGDGLTQTSKFGSFPPDPKAQAGCATFGWVQYDPKRCNSPRQLNILYRFSIVKGETWRTITVVQIVQSSYCIFPAILYNMLVFGR
jgi:hypothetical protein